jgi:hypothetical protein
MARYRAKMQLFVNGTRIRQGQEFESDLKPGKQWEALDPPAAKRGKAQETAKPQEPAKSEEEAAK